jgi:hypothetical protein
MHLNTEELVDIAEGARPEGAAPHLAACEACRAQLRDLRAMLSAAQAVEVPEPSPLFWDHLSARVRTAVTAEQAAQPRRSSRWYQASEGESASGTERLLAARAYAFAAVAAGVLIAVAVSSRVQAPAPAVPPPPIGVAVPPPSIAAAQTDPGAELLTDVAPESDPSLTLVATMTDDVDLETAREAGLAPRGSAEHAVTHMSDGELRELGRLLREEMARSGA